MISSLGAGCEILKQSCKCRSIENADSRSISSASTLSGMVQGPLKVDDVMTKQTLFSVREDTSIDEGGHNLD